MCHGRSQPAFGADSAQSLADAIHLADEYAIADALKGRVGPDRDSCIECGRSIEVHCQNCGECNALPAAIIPRCIACSEPALPDDVYCADHALTEEPSVRHPGLRDREPYAGGFAANE